MLRCQVTTIIHSEKCEGYLADPVGLVCCKAVHAQCEKEALPNNYEFSWPICAEHRQRYLESKNGENHVSVD